MQKMFFTVLLLSLVLAPAAHAQQEKGDKELQIQGSLNLDIGSDATATGSANLLWGRFYTDQSELGLSGTVAFNSDGDLAGLGGPFWRYNFRPRKKSVPYFGVSAATPFGDFFGSAAGDIFATVELGNRWFLDRETAFTVAAQAFYDVDESDLADTLTIVFGFSHFWD